MFGNKKIKDLEEKVKDLGLELDKQVKLSKFLLNNKKEDVVVKVKSICLGIFACFSTYELQVEYLYDNQIKNSKMDLGLHEFKVENVENINDKVAIIKIKNNYGETKIIQLDKITNELVEITLLAQHFANIGKKVEEKPSKIADKETKTTESEEKSKENNKKTETKVYDKNGIKYKDTQYSVLMQYYTKYNLNVDIKDFKPMKRMGRKEAATLLYLFDKYKYVSEIIKHIGLSRATVMAYAYALRRNGYLIYEHEVGRVANGCLIYKGV